MDLTVEAARVFQDEPARKDYRVGVILIAPSGRCLALLRAETKKMGGGTWGVPGGKVEIGETLAQATIREAGEETGVIPSSVTLIHAEQYGDIQFRTYVGYVSDEFAPKLDHEHTDYQWVFPDQWPEPTFSGMKSVLENAAAMQTLRISPQQKFSL